MRRRRWPQPPHGDGLALGKIASALTLQVKGGRDGLNGASLARARRRSYRVAGAGRPDRDSMAMAFGRVLAPRFQAGALLLLIRWRGGAARRAGFCFFFLLNAPAALAAAAAWRWPRPRQNRERTDSAGERGPRWPQWRLSRAREAPELPGRRRRPAGSRQHGDGLRTCARSKISGWRVAAPYPLAGRRRAPRWILFFLFAECAGGAGRSRRMAMASPSAKSRAH